MKQNKGIHFVCFLTLKVPVAIDLYFMNQQFRMFITDEESYPHLGCLRVSE